MKHIELFENFSQMSSGENQMTLKPLDISMTGDSVVYFSFGDAISFTLTSSDKAEKMVDSIRSIMSNSFGEPDPEFESSLMIINQPGVAYVLVEPEEEPGVSAKGKGFEDQTPEIDFWITGTPSDELSNPNGTGEYMTSVSVLKRDTVITANAGSQPFSEVQSIPEFLMELKSAIE